MMVLKRKQVVVLSLILMIIVAGILQYTYNKSGSSSDGLDDISAGNIYENMVLDEEGDEDVRLGEAVYVDSELMDDDIFVKKEDGEDKDEEGEKALEASKEANDFFAQAKINREVTRSRDQDVLKEITQDATSSEELKKSAQELMMQIIENSEKEMRIETLIKEKGYKDVVVLFGSDGSVDVVVKAPSLTSVQVAQIADIASRHADVDIKDVYVRQKF
ncbi:MAG TPA: SpoIIIAH-like family protein [Ruminiclostridium sp.]|jgi:stage III sporulation protein AH|uniref:Stage III sporulation protein AH n=2 Tax=Acetivibrio saccincola TaxID=1677857 RepID=A0A2S8RCN7_9FIRM|nr:SpoIIIAH-like family protein [Acetivibrio saccincola]HAA43177.1 SpoIIIAH-like family protein [Ruminiclostridium sp.]NLW26515.1 SpoIIIAH-like family protein [Acetivibrio saccincola]PQQ67562.1 hypothetical protein B9R14_12935 [Acetivibrio saccincola]HOA98137.1 SpoIIIAH-like family protein [Acetivibrio saccincola]HQD28447.1 SpoIIIAH-like family protein [Acetivibrio saccincola]